MNLNNKKLPSGWLTIPLQDVIQTLMDFRGRTPKKLGMAWGGGDIPALSALNVRPGEIQLDRTKNFGSKELHDCWMVYGSTQKGDVVITTEAPLGNVAQIPDDRLYILSQRVVLLRPEPTVMLSAFLAYQLRSNIFQELLQANDSGSTVRGIRQSRLVRLTVPVPPLNEQRRIVAKVEALRDRASKARAALDTIPQLLDQFRQSVLAAAFRGDLTADWREANPDVEPAEQLLERIRAERRRKWEETELTKMIANGKPPQNDKWKSKYKEPEIIDFDTLYELPNNWIYTPVDLLSTKVTDGVHKKPKYVESGIPFLSVKNLTASRNQISFKETKFVTIKDHEEFIKRADPEYGDILITKDGTLGVTRKIRTKKIFSIFVSLALVKPVNHELSDFLEMAFKSPQLQTQMVGIGIGLTHIHLCELRKYVIPLPPLAEQKEIVKRIEGAFSYIDKIETEIKANLEQLDTLDQSILAKAFRGELVPQDPNDEPASELLKRIQAAKAAATPKKKTRTKRQKNTDQLNLDL